jgi:acyl-CoA thioester hydrolase
VSPHLHPVRVYYEDTDLAGVVYYANYLKFIERGRTEALRGAGVDQNRLKDELGLVFVVVRVTADWRRPAVFDDLLSVETRLARLGGASVDMAQRVLRGVETLFEAEVRMACMGRDGRAARLPADMRAALEG